MIEPVVWGMYLVILYISFFLILTFFDESALRESVEWLENFPSVSLVIPAYNEEDTIAMTIESALSVDYPDYEVIVVNDGSEDDTLEIVKEYEESGDVKLIDQENQGKGAALNAGLEIAEGELFGVVDADSRLKKNSLKNIVSEMTDEMVGIASAMKVYQPSNLLQKMQWLEYMVGIFLRNIMGSIDAIHVTPGPLSIYRTDKLEELGGFDEDTLVEDQEICFRFQDNHYRVGHSRKGEVYTVAPKTVREFYDQRYRWYRGSLENLIEYKHMILNPKYGDFGMFGTTAKILQAGLSVLGIFLISYYILNPIYSFARDFAQLGFSMFNINLSYYTVSNILQEFYWWTISQRFLSLILLGSVFLFSLFLAYLSARHTEEKLFEQGIIPTFTYLFWYVFFIGGVWSKVFADVALDWGDRKW
jgi:cellulose synthase/poly-beta-1,6-N-acetylglucosamine synthase-like glycosyltransferase